MPEHDPRVRLTHMRNYASEAIELLGDKTIAEVEGDRTLQLALVRLVEVVGEAASRVPTDFRTEHPEIEWRRASATRNLLIHGYDIIRYDILVQTIRTDLPRLVAAVDRLLSSEF